MNNETLINWKNTINKNINRDIKNILKVKLNNLL